MQDKSMVSKALGSVRRLDRFGQIFRMKLDDGIVDQRSFMGSFLTVMLTSVVLLFMYTKV